MRTSSIFNFQHVATRRNWVAKRTQNVVPNNVAMLRQSVAIVRSGLANIGQTMLSYVALN